MRVPTYVIFHPQLQLLEVYHLLDRKYQLAAPDDNQRFWIESLGLFLGTWIGEKADYAGCWLRWWNSSGDLVLWGGELLELERQQVAAERQSAKVEHQRAEEEHKRAEEAEAKNIHLAEQLRAMGVDPDAM